MIVLWHEDVQIKGSRYSRGSRTYGTGGNMVGYRLSCSLCDYDRRVNGPLTEARPIGRDHAWEEHGIRGMENY